MGRGTGARWAGSGSVRPPTSGSAEPLPATAEEAILGLGAATWLTDNSWRTPGKEQLNTVSGRRALATAESQRRGPAGFCVGATHQTRLCSGAGERYQRRPPKLLDNSLTRSYRRVVQHCGVRRAARVTACAIPSWPAKVPHVQDGSHLAAEAIAIPSVGTSNSDTVGCAPPCLGAQPDHDRLSVGKVDGDRVSA